MPKFHAKTTQAEQVWASPDGQRTIYEVVLDTGQGSAKAKTYSAAIAKVGFDGELDSYEKVGKMGPETYVRQVQKEGGYQGGGGFKGGGGRAPVDPFTMYLSYAKDIAVALITAGKGTIDQDKYAEALDIVLHGGKTLFEGRPDAPGSKPDGEPLPEPEPETDVNQTPIDMKSLNDLFPS